MRDMGVQACRFERDKCMVTLFFNYRQTIRKARCHAVALEKFQIFDLGILNLLQLTHFQKFLA
jgi:uncharacterized protein YhhL (DUF1145 family)